MKHTILTMIVALTAIFAFDILPAAAADADDTPLVQIPVSAERAVGDPDAFGYTFIDSDEPDGPNFDFVDISTTGTSHNFVSDNSTASNIPLGFDFSFYDVLFDVVAINANGYAKFDGVGFGDSSNECNLPTTSGNENVIFAVHDDLDQFEGTPNGDAWFQNFAAGSCPYDDYGGACFVNQWHTYYDRTSPDDATEFELILLDNHQIIVQILDAGNKAGSSSTTGIEDATGTIATQYACNTANSLKDDLAIRFEPPQLIVEKTSPDFVAAGQPINYTITAKNLTDTALTDVSLHDVLLQPFSNLIPGTLQANLPPAPTVSADSVITWDGTIGVGQTLEVTFAITTEKNIVGTLPNTVVVTPSIGTDPINATTNTQLIGAATEAYVSEPSFEIPRESCITDVITVDTPGVIFDLNVGLNIDHSARGALRVTLTAPDGTSVVIVDPPNFFADNLDALLDDANSTAINSGGNHDTNAPIFENNVQPTNPLASLNARLVAGDWQLEACSESVPGTLNVWSLKFGTTLDFFLSVSKTVTPTVVISDTVVDYTIVVANDGLAPFNGGVLTDVIPADVELVPNTLVASKPIVSENNGTIKWEGDLAAQERVIITFSATTITAPLPTEPSVLITNTVVLTQAELVDTFTFDTFHQSFAGDHLFHSQPRGVVVGQSCTRFTQQVTETIFPSDVRVGLRLDTDDDTRAFTEGRLIHPSGVQAQLFSSSGFSSNNYNLLFSDASTLASDDGNSDALAPLIFERLAQPDRALSIFDLLPAQGEWILEICRDRASDAQLLDWALFFDEADESAEPFVEKSAEQPSILTQPAIPTVYTLRIHNPSPVAKTTTMTDILPDELNIVLGSLTTTGSAIDATVVDDVVTWSGEIAAQSTITIEFSTLLDDAVADGTLFSNVATLAPANSFPEHGITDHQAFVDTARAFTGFGNSFLDLNLIDEECIISPVNVDLLGVIENVRVGLNASSSARRFDVTLHAPNDAFSLELTHPTVNGDNYDVLFIDSGDTPDAFTAHDVERPFYEIPYPITNGIGAQLADFRGLTALGEWRLEICDIDIRNTFFHHWTLFIEVNPFTFDKTGVPLVVEPNDVLTYTLTVRNDSPEIQTNVTISDPIPANSTFVAGSLVTDGNPDTVFDAVTNAVTWTGDLAVGETISITFNTTVDLGTTHRERITNTATLNGTATRTVVSEVFNDQDVLFTTAGLQPTILIPNDECPNLTLSTLRVPDSATVEKLRVGINGNMQPAVRTNIDLVSPTGTRVNLNGNFTFSPEADYLLDDDAGDNDGPQSPDMPFYDRVSQPSGNLASYIGEDAQGIWTLELCHDDDFTDQDARIFHWTLFFDVNNDVTLNVEKSADTQVITLGSTIAYSITVRNSGGAIGQNTQISDSLPANVTLVPGSLVTDRAPAPTFNNGVIQWQGDVPPNNQSVTLNFSVTVDSPTDFVTNTVAVSQTTLDETLNDTHVAQFIDGFDRVRTQQTSLALSECRGGYRASEIEITDAFHVQSVAVGVHSDLNGAAQIVLESPDGRRVALWTQGVGGAARFNTTFAGGPGSPDGLAQAAGLPFYAQQVAPVGNLDELAGINAQGTWRLLACSNGIDFNKTVDHWTLMFKTGVSIVKSADLHSVSGTQSPVTIVAHNPTANPLNDVTITDELPTEVDLVDGTLTASKAPAPTFDGTTVNWTGDIAAGETVTLTFETRTVALIDTTFVNTATLTHASLPQPIHSSVTTQVDAAHAFGTFSRQGEHVICEGNSSTFLPIEVTQAVILEDIEVGFNVIAGERDHINATLFSPNGTRVSLFRDSDDFRVGQSNFDILFRSSAGVGAHDDTNHLPGYPLYDQVQKPRDTFDDFIGENALGTWNLLICDDFDQAYVDHISLFFDGDRIGIEKEASVPAIDFDDTVVYTITVDNLFPQPLVGATITDTLPNNMQILPGTLDASSGVVQVNNGVLEWFGDLFPTSPAVTIEYQVRPIEDLALEITNTATISHTILDETASAIAGVMQYSEPDALVSKYIEVPIATGCETPTRIPFNVPDSFLLNAVEVGLNISTFTDSTTNARDTIQATLIAPDGTFTRLIQVTGSGNNAENFDVTISEDGALSVHANGTHDVSFPFYENVRFPDGDLTVFEGLNVNGEWVLEFCDSIDLTFLHHATLFFFEAQPDLVVSKGNSAFVATVGEIVEYQLFIDNNGIIDSDTVTLSDTLPAQLQFVPGSIKQTPGIPPMTFEDGVIRWEGIVSAGANLTFTYEAQVIEGGIITNIATIDEASLLEPETSESTLLVPNLIHRYETVEPVTIPDEGCITQKMTLMNHSLLFNVNVGFVATHARRGDLEVRLTAPNDGGFVRAASAGFPIDLLNSSGDANANFNILFDELNGGAANDGNADAVIAPFYERLVEPTGFLSDLGFSDPYGIWTLEVCDVVAGETGTLERWSLDVIAVSAETQLIDSTFTDWDENAFCVTDELGANDTAALSDVTEFCISSNQLDTLFFQFAFDEVDITGSGAHCALISADGDGNAEAALCATIVGSSPTALEKVELFSCDNSSATSCNDQVIGETLDNGQVAFSNSAAGTFDANDSRVEVGVPFTALNINILRRAAGDMEVRPAGFTNANDLTQPNDTLIGNNNTTFGNFIQFNAQNDTGLIQDPTFVLLSLLEAVLVDDQVVVRWESEAEINHAGYEVFRHFSADGEQTRVSQFVESAGLNGQGATYELVDADAPTGTLFYTLVDIDQSGKRRTHGPVSVTVSPTAVQLATVHTATGSALVVLLTMLLLVGLTWRIVAQKRG